MFHKGRSEVTLVANIPIHTFEPISARSKDDGMKTDYSKVHLVFAYLGQVAFF